MKLIIAEKPDDIGLICSELIDEFKSSNLFSIISLGQINPKMEIKETLNHETFGENGNIVICQLGLDGNIDFDFQKAKESKKLIVVACGPKYQNIIKQIFNEVSNEDVNASMLFDHNDITIIIEKMAAKKIDKR